MRHITFPDQRHRPLEAWKHTECLSGIAVGVGFLILGHELLPFMWELLLWPPCKISAWDGRPIEVLRALHGLAAALFPLSWSRANILFLCWWETNHTNHWDKMHFYYTSHHPYSLSCSASSVFRAGMWFHCADSKIITDSKCWLLAGSFCSLYCCEMSVRHLSKELPTVNSGLF